MLDIVILSFDLRRLGVLSRRLEIVEATECVSKLPRYVRATRDINTADYFVLSPSATCLNSCGRHSSPGRRRRQSEQRDSRLSCRASRSRCTFAPTAAEASIPSCLRLVCRGHCRSQTTRHPRGSLRRQARLCAGPCVFLVACDEESGHVGPTQLEPRAAQQCRRDCAAGIDEAHPDSSEEDWRHPIQFGHPVWIQVSTLAL